jgi:hypothetical protein
MASISQLNPYHCDQCGTANIVAAPVLYQQGTRTYSSTLFTAGAAGRSFLSTDDPGRPNAPVICAAAMNQFHCDLCAPMTYRTRTDSSESIS